MLVALGLYVLYVLGTYLAIAALLARLCKPRRHTIGIFHPYSAAGGGGERVLFAVLQALSHMRPQSQLVIYTGDSVSVSALLAQAESYFGLSIPADNVRLVRLSLRSWTEAAKYPVFTLLGQFCGSAVLVQEALFRARAHVWIDTHGHAFGYWFVRVVCGIPVIPYVHYPAMSTDMIQRIRVQRPAYNNSTRVTGSATVSRLKLVYYQVLYIAYSLMGRFVRVAICNSSWTRDHIAALWSCRNVVVFPPCNIQRFVQLSIDKPTANYAVSLGQFRPEKDHELQIDAFALFYHSHTSLNAKLLLIGSCRGAEDEARVATLRQRAQAKGISEAVEFHLNVSFARLLELLAGAKVGLHTMWNEHFGICVVELMAAGLVTIAHRSGGPKSDIIEEGKTGYLAETTEEYAQCLSRAFTEFLELGELRKAARRASLRYSDESFRENLITVLRAEI